MRLPRFEALGYYGRDDHQCGPSAPSLSCPCSPEPPLSPGALLASFCSKPTLERAKMNHISPKSSPGEAVGSPRRISRCSEKRGRRRRPLARQRWRGDQRPQALQAPAHHPDHAAAAGVQSLLRGLLKALQEGTRPLSTSAGSDPLKRSLSSDSALRVLWAGKRDPGGRDGLDGAGGAGLVPEPKSQGE